MNPLIIFDGYCNLCNHWVDRLIRLDNKKIFRFTANQLPAGTKILSEHAIFVTEHTFYLLEDGLIYSKSNAAMRIVKHLPAPHNWLIIFKVIPLVFRDKIYDIIARNRYNWFGKRATCRLPTSDDAERFL